jgi:hypothetical protein
MHFCAQMPGEERDTEGLRVLHFSLNTPIVAIEELPVGPARAGVALFAAPEGAMLLAIAVRSLRTGQTISYAPDEEIEGERDAAVAVDAALSFAEGMGFLFDEDEIAARGDDGRREAIARWRGLVEDVCLPTTEPAPSRPPRLRAEETAPVLDLVCEVPVREGLAEAQRIDVREGDEVVLADITIPAEAAGDAAAGQEAVLSKFRLVMGSIAPERGERETVAPETEGAVAAPAAPMDSRIRLLSRF